MLEHSPTFAPLFKKDDSYLPLLWLGDKAKSAIRKIQKTLIKCPDVELEVSGLLTDLNWRPHLVGAVSILTGAASKKTLAALWSAADQGSWVSPQLAVVASLKDPFFELHAKERLLARCPVASSELASLSWLERHSVAGPSSSVQRSSKLYSALAALSTLGASPPEWLRIELSTDESIAMLENDPDKGGDIAMTWHRTWQTLNM